MKSIVSNRSISYNYEIIQKYNSGIVLFGYEVKSVKSGKVSVNESFISINRGEVYINHLYIAPIGEIDKLFKYNPTRIRKLLLNKNEIDEIFKYTQRAGFTCVPLNIFLKGGKIKLQIAVVRGLKNFDKREKEKMKDSQRDIERSQNIKYKV
jgi:SsrA-binding protein